MSTSSAGSAKSSRYLNFDEYVDLKLQTTRASIKTTDLLVALAGVAAMFLGYLLLFVTFDQWIIPGGFGIGLRWTLLSTLLVLTAAWLIWKVGVPYFRSVNRLYAAREIEKADPALRSNLLNLVDLRASGREIDPAILRALEKNAAVGLQNIDVTQAVDHRPLMRTAYVLLAVVILFCLYALLSPKKISNSIWRSLLPAANVTVSTRTEIVDVQPGDTTVLAREKVLVTAEIAGEIPPQVFALFTTADGKFRDEPVELRSDEPGATKFSGLLIGENGQGLLQDLTYTIQAGDATSRAYQITVIQPPSATVDRVAFEFPAYMKLDPTEQAGGKIDSWEGTRVAISAHTNIPIQSATVEFLDSADGQPTGEESAVTVAADGRQLTAAWTLAFRSDRTFAKFYRIQCRTESGATDPQPTVYEIQIRPDLPPDVALLEPVRDLEVPANAIVPLLVEARDPDFELSHINLHLKKNGQPIHKQLLSEGRQQRLLLQHDLALERFVLVPGDVLELWVQAFDNKQPRPNIKVTPELKLTIVEPVSNKEVQEKLAQDKAQRDQRLQEARQDQNPGDAQDEQPTAQGADPKPGPDGPREGARPDPMPQEQRPQNDPQQGRQDGADQAAQDQGAQNGNPGDTRQERGAKEGDGNERPLRSDGEDDQQALEQILKSLDPDPKKPDDSSNQDQATPKPPKPTPDQQSERNPNSNPMPGGSDRPMPGSEKNADPQPADGQPANSDPAMPSDSPMPSNPKSTSQGKPSNERPMPGSESPTKPDPAQPGSEMTDSPDNPDSKPSKNSNPGDPKRPPKEPGASKTTQGTDTKPGPQDPQSPDRSDPNPGDAPSQDPATSGTPRKTEKPTERPDPANPSPSDSPTRSAPDSPRPMPADSGQTPAEDTPMNSDMSPNTAKSAGNRDAGERPMPAGNDATKPDGTTPQKSEPQKSGTESPAPEAPDAQPKPADGTEKGTGTPDRDPKTKPGTTDSPDVQRDPKQPPERRPGNAAEAPQPPGDNANPPRNRDNPSRNPERTRSPSDQKVKDADGQKNPTEQQLDQQNTTDKQSMKGQPDRRPADPNSANEDLKGKGAEQQRSRTGSGGEGGSSKEDKSGKSGSSNPGEGDSSDRPGSTEKADPSSGESSEGSGRDAENGGKPKAGSRSDGKSSAGQPPAGAKPEGQKPGQEGTPDGGPNEREPGKGKSPDQGGGDEKSADSPEGGAKPGAEGASKQGGGGEGQKGQSDSGGKKAGTGQPGTTEGGNAAGGAGSGPIESEAANLEYKKQATELVLKRLQEGLERGDIDPELLERLGWSPEELRRFTDRLARHLEESRSSEESPESAARRLQFEEMLKSLDVHRRGTARQGENSPQRDINFTDSSRNTVPKEYRSAYEKFSREINRQRSRPTGKP